MTNDLCDKGKEGAQGWVDPGGAENTDWCSREVLYIIWGGWIQVVLKILIDAVVKCPT